MSELAQACFMEAATAIMKKRSFAELCELVEETIDFYHKERKPLAPPTVRNGLR